MLKSYEAIYNNGQFQWLTEKPEIKTARVIVTILEEADNKLSNDVFHPLPLQEKAKPWAILLALSLTRKIGNV